MGNSQEKDNSNHPIGKLLQSHESQPSVSIQKIFQDHAVRSAFEHSSPGLSRLQFQDIFQVSPHFAERMFYDCLRHTQQAHEDLDSCYIQQAQFHSYAQAIMQMRDRHEQIDWTLRTFCGNSESLHNEDISLLLNTCFKINLTMAKLSYTNEDPRMGQAVIQAMAEGLLGAQSGVGQASCLRWVSRSCPRLLDCVHDYVRAVFSGQQLSSQTTAGDTRGVLEATDSTLEATGSTLEAAGSTLGAAGSTLEATDSTLEAVGSTLEATGSTLEAAGSTLGEGDVPTSPLLSLPLLCAVSSYVPTCYTSATESGTRPSLADLRGRSGWSLLYDSNTQGLSVNRFKHHVMSYAAPTVTFLHFNQQLYCLGSDCEWSDKGTRWGGIDCFLLQIQQKYQLLQAGPDMIYLNTKDRRSPKGLQIGKDSRSTVLQIDEEFSAVKHYGIDVPLDRVEVWGCGSVAVLDAQCKQVQWETQQAQRSKDRKLKVEDWSDSPDRQILEYGGVKTQHAER